MVGKKNLKNLFAAAAVTLMLALVPTASAKAAVDIAAEGDLSVIDDPCFEGGALNFAFCVVQTGEGAVCIIVYGGSANKDCLPILAADEATNTALVGPCDDGGAINLVYCARDTTEEAVCIIVYGGGANPNCLPILVGGTIDLAASASFGPCDDGGAINLALCTVDTTEESACIIVYGGGADPRCIRNLVITKPIEIHIHAD